MAFFLSSELCQKIVLFFVFLLIVKTILPRKSENDLKPNATALNYHGSVKRWMLKEVGLDKKVWAKLQKNGLCSKNNYLPSCINDILVHTSTKSLSNNANSVLAEYLQSEYIDIQCETKRLTF